MKHLFLKHTVNVILFMAVCMLLFSSCQKDSGTQIGFTSFTNSLSYTIHDTTKAASTDLAYSFASPDTIYYIDGYSTQLNESAIFCSSGGKTTTMTFVNTGTNSKTFGELRIVIGLKTYSGFPAVSISTYNKANSAISGTFTSMVKVGNSATDSIKITGNFNILKPGP